MEKPLAADADAATMITASIALATEQNNTDRAWQTPSLPGPYGLPPTAFAQENP